MPVSREECWSHLITRFLLSLLMRVYHPPICKDNCTYLRIQCDYWYSFREFWQAHQLVKWEEFRLQQAFQKATWTFYIETEGGFPDAVLTQHFFLLATWRDHFCAPQGWNGKLGLGWIHVQIPKEDSAICELYVDGTQQVSTPSQVCLDKVIKPLLCPSRKRAGRLSFYTAMSTALSHLAPNRAVR